MNYTKAYGKLWGGTLPELGGNFRLCAVDQKRSFFPRAGPFLDLLCPLRDLSCLQGPLQADRLTGRPLTGRLLTGRPLTGRFLTGDTFNYRKAYGKLRGGTLPELGGNFRLCAVDQKKSFFPRAGPFLDLLRGPYGQAYGEASSGKESLREATGRDFTRIGRNFRFCAVDQKKPIFLRAGPFLDLCLLRDLSPLQGPLGRPPYGKAPYGEASYGKGGFLRETPLITGKLTRRLGPYGKPLTRRDGPYGKGRSLTGRAGPLRVLHTEERRRRGLREGRALTGSPLRGGTVLTRRAGPLREGPGSLTGPSQRRTTGRLGPYGKPGRSLREGPVPYGKGRVPYGSFTEKDDEEAGPLWEAPRDPKPLT